MAKFKRALKFAAVKLYPIFLANSFEHSRQTGLQKHISTESLYLITHKHLGQKTLQWLDLFNSWQSFLPFLAECWPLFCSNDVWVYKGPKKAEKSTKRFKNFCNILFPSRPMRMTFLCNLSFILVPCPWKPIFYSLDFRLSLCFRGFSLLRKRATLKLT